MLEIKVLCDCGQKYKFDVDPIGGRMPFTVACPICGADGTGKANEILGRLTPPPQAPGLALAAHGTPTLTPASAVPAPGLAPSLSSPPPLPAAPGGLRINRPVAPAVVQAPEQAEVPVEASPARPARFIPGVGLPRREAANAVPTGKPPSFGLGFAGAIAGALIGALIYYLLFKYTGLKFKLIAVAVGYLSGMGAEWLGRKEGSKELGMIAGTLTLAAVIGAQYLVVRGWWREGIQDESPGVLYAQAVEEAKEVMQAIPNGTDEEIRVLLASEDAEPEESPDPASVSDEEVQDFRENHLPQIQGLASGKITQQDYERSLMADVHGEDTSPSTAEDEESTFKTVFLLFLLSKVNLVSLAAAAGLAFKLCSNA